jgi:hypothetical protein
VDRDYEASDPASVVLDIGPGHGALVLDATAAQRGQEIGIGPVPTRSG